MATQGDLTTSNLTYLASQNKFGNIKALTPGVSEPAVDPSVPAAVQEAVAEEQGEAAKEQTAIPSITDQQKALLDQQVQNTTNEIRESSAKRMKEMQKKQGNESTEPNNLFELISMAN